MKNNAAITDVTLEFACHEHIDEHNYCKSCSRTIIDFTCLKSRDLADAINKSDGKVCGIFKNTQLSQQFVKYAVVGVIATSLTVAARAQEDKGVLVNDSTLKACTELDGNMDSFVSAGIMILPIPIPNVGHNALKDSVEKLIHYPETIREKYTTLNTLH